MFVFNLFFNSRSVVEILIHLQAKCEKNNLWQEEQMLKWSIFNLQDFFEVISLAVSHHEHLGCFIRYLQQSDSTNSNFPVILWPLSKGQGHSNWNCNAEFCCVLQHTKFEKNVFTSAPAQANVKGMFYKSTLIAVSPLKITHAQWFFLI